MEGFDFPVELPADLRCNMSFADVLNGWRFFADDKLTAFRKDWEGFGGCWLSLRKNDDGTTTILATNWEGASEVWPAPHGDILATDWGMRR
jgi:hypothetical protein